MESVILTVDGKLWEGWTEMSVSRSLKAIAGEFDLSVTTRWSAAAPRVIREGQPCTVRLGADTVLTGYIDDFIPSYDADNVEIRVMGRDKTGDLVDCSVVHSSGKWKGVRLEQVAADVCRPFGITVITETPTGEAFASVVLEQGETGFELLDRLAKQRGVLLTSDGAGNLIITRASSVRAGVSLVLGKNILAARGRFSWRERNSQYIIEDPEINRYRPRILVNEDSLTVGGASIRGEWYKARMLGEARTTEITVAGWREQGDSGPLWQTNRLVDIDDSIQNLKTTWLISGVTWTDGAQGRMTVLALVPPESLDMPEMKAKTKKSAKAVATWD